jgi:hypothetical protein
MKKLIILLGFALVFALAACGSNEDSTKESDNNATEQTSGAKEETTEEKDMGIALLKNHIEIAHTINDYYDAISAYLKETANPEAKAETLETLKADAITAADEAVAALDAYTFVEEDALDDETKAALTEAITDVKDAFAAYKEALNSEEADITAAEEKFAAYAEKIAPLYEANGLTSSPDLLSELQ